ncbi:MAG: hypothetical protein SFW66_08010 [Gammaproteobacteria bacterium]|nr:hypothetical protein [Gammaproteobacteria bacterium]
MMLYKKITDALKGEKVKKSETGVIDTFNGAGFLNLCKSQLTDTGEVDFILMDSRLRGNDNYATTPLKHAGVNCGENGRV